MVPYFLLFAQPECLLPSLLPTIRYSPSQVPRLRHGLCDQRRVGSASPLQTHPREAVQMLNVWLCQCGGMWANCCCGGVPLKKLVFKKMKGIVACSVLKEAALSYVGHAFRPRVPCSSRAVQWTCYVLMLGSLQPKLMTLCFHRSEKQLCLYRMIVSLTPERAALLVCSILCSTVTYASGQPLYCNRSYTAFWARWETWFKKYSVCNGRSVGNVEIRTDLPTLCCGLNVKFAVILVVWIKTKFVLMWACAPLCRQQFSVYAEYSYLSRKWLGSCLLDKSRRTVKKFSPCWL